MVKTAKMDHRIALRLLYVLLFACFVGIGAVQPVAQWISTSFGIRVMFCALVGYAAFTVGVIWLINKINRDHYTIEPEPKTPVAVSETALILNYMRQDELSQKSIPLEFSTEPVRPPDSKA